MTTTMCVNMMQVGFNFPIFNLSHKLERIERERERENAVWIRSSSKSRF